MRDEDFDTFIKSMGGATSYRPATPESMARYRGRLPNYLLQRWQEEGWRGYANGLFWTVNPQDFEHILPRWLESTSLRNLDKFHVFGRTGFGELYAWAEHYGCNVIISCPIGVITAIAQNFAKPSPRPDLGMSVFFGRAEKEEFDLEDDNDERLFERAAKKLGPLGEKEIYGFEPALALGGPRQLAHLAKLDMAIHLNLLSEMTSMRIFGMQ
jgi:hypothetical protein